MSRFLVKAAALMLLLNASHCPGYRHQSLPQHKSLHQIVKGLDGDRHDTSTSSPTSPHTSHKSHSTYTPMAKGKGNGTGDNTSNGDYGEDYFGSGHWYDRGHWYGGKMSKGGYKKMSKFGKKRMMKMKKSKGGMMVKKGKGDYYYKGRCKDTAHQKTPPCHPKKRGTPTPTVSPVPKPGVPTKPTTQTPKKTSSPSYPIPKTGAPTQPPKSLPPTDSPLGYIVSPYFNLYSIDFSLVPADSDYNELEELTNIYIMEFLKVNFASTSLITFVRSLTEITEREFITTRPVRVNYNTTIYFSPLSSFIPPQAQLNGLLQSAFRGENMVNYISFLQTDLPSTNAFSTTTAVEFSFTPVSPSRSRPQKAPQGGKPQSESKNGPKSGRPRMGPGLTGQSNSASSSSGSSSSTRQSAGAKKAGLASAASAAAGILIVAGVVVYSRSRRAASSHRQEPNNKLVMDEDDGGLTIDAETTVEGSGSTIDWRTSRSDSRLNENGSSVTRSWSGEEDDGRSLSYLPMEARVDAHAAVAPSATTNTTILPDGTKTMETVTVRPDGSRTTAKRHES